MATDRHGLNLTGASGRAAELYQRAIDAFHCYAGQPFKLLNQATDDSPGFVMAYLTKAYLTAIGSDTSTRRLATTAFAAARGLPADAREAAHRMAVEHLLNDRIRAAGRILEDISIAHPRDTLALQAGQTIDFMTGDSRMLRDRIGRVLPAWSEGMDGYHAILAMHAFGLEETGSYAQAERAGRRAIELERRNGWAQHAVAHVLEMQDRRAEGVAWMRADVEAWTTKSFFAIHNWWHLALFHLGLGDVDEVLALYDASIWGEGSSMALDMVDAAAILWRLQLQGVDVGGRWAALSDSYAKEPRGLYAFDDVHAVIAHVGAGRDKAADAALRDMEKATGLDGDNATVTAEVGLPIARAIRAFGAGDNARSVDLLRGVRREAYRFGGSHAQRDLLDLTLLAAAERSGETSLVRALQAERAGAV